MSLFSRKPSVKTRDEGGVCIVTLKGDMSYDAGEHLIERTLQERIDGGCVFFLLDMRKVGVLSPAATGTCLMALRKLAKLKGNIGILRPSGYAKTLIKIANLDRLFPVYRDEATALRRIREDRLYEAESAKWFVGG